jgi:hypothetical protein
VARIVVTGGRDNFDFHTMEAALNKRLSPGDALVHGDAAGADRICAQVAKYMGVETEPYPADWKPNGVFNPKAGPERNQRMIDSGIDAALIFSGGSGTADMVARIKKADIPFWDYSIYYDKKLI